MCFLSSGTLGTAYKIKPCEASAMVKHMRTLWMYHFSCYRWRKLSVLSGSHLELLLSFNHQMQHHFAGQKASRKAVSMQILISHPLLHMLMWQEKERKVSTWRWYFFGSNKIWNDSSFDQLEIEKKILASILKLLCGFSFFPEAI